MIRFWCTCTSPRPYPLNNSHPEDLTFLWKVSGMLTTAAFFGPLPPMPADPLREELPLLAPLPILSRVELPAACGKLQVLVSPAAPPAAAAVGEGFLAEGEAPLAGGVEAPATRLLGRLSLDAEACKPCWDKVASSASGDNPSGCSQDHGGPSGSGHYKRQKITRAGLGDAPSMASPWAAVW